MTNPMQYFPYEPRPGQEALVRFIGREVGEGRHVCVHASTGFGKTPAILAALLPLVRHGGAIVWAVRTGTETDRPIEELKVINERLGSDFLGLSYRGKRDMCLLARDLEFEDLAYEDVSFLCKHKVKGGECEYYLNFHSSFEGRDFMRPMLYSEILRECEERAICPYLVQRELLPIAQVVALNYNYIVGEALAWTIKRVVPFKRSFLVVDEAHNLQQACSSLNSIRITLGTAERALREMERFKSPHAGEVVEFLQALRAQLEREGERLEREEVELDVEKFLSSLASQRAKKVDELRGWFDLVGRYGDEVRKLQLGAGERPRSSLHRLGEFGQAMCVSAGVDGIAFLASKEGGSPSFELWDMRSSEVLAPRWEEFLACVFCSGTLEPVKAFAETVGLEGYKGKSLSSHYDLSRIRALVLRELSTRGEELPREMAERYVRVLGQLIEQANVNLAIFCASYRIQADLIRAGLKRVVERSKRQFFQEVRGMTGDESREVLDAFKRCSKKKLRGVLCASASGRFAEGADFPGEELEAIFLVGIPFERVTARTQLYIDYYERLYGKQKGRYYSYVVPALRRASQALGRALRSEHDRALLICGDERYADRRFFYLLPDYVRGRCEVIRPEQLPAKVKEWSAGSKLD